jgi:ComF family protein
MNIVSDFSNLLYPAYCSGCGHALLKYEKAICSSCQTQLPRSGFHDQPNNPVEQLFWGRVPIHSATAFLRMPRKSPVHNMIHELKYRQNPETGIFLGKLFGLELKASLRMNPCTCIVPVPLHPEKEYQRGYNQCDKIAQGLAEVMQLPVFYKALGRTAHTASQTRKSRYQRWENVGQLFTILEENKLKNQHILLVDDVITTGATLEACAQQLQEIEGVQLSIAALAFPIHA